MDTRGESGPMTTRSVLSLARAIRTRELSASEVVGTHIECHQRLAPRINALAADRFDLARREATLADELLRSAGPAEVLPPLLGVPFTVKESIALTGMPQSAGLVARKDCLATRNAPALQRLLDAGAIPLGVTNTSELTLWIESSNRLYGRTNNPYDPTRTAGGSSGGEGAAVGSGASPFGLASDIAGSIRVPGLFCGVFGHKPSSGLVPNTAGRGRADHPESARRRGGETPDLAKPAGARRAPHAADPDDARPGAAAPGLTAARAQTATRRRA
jgi:fatty acid amide hydrolase 2